MVIFTMNVFAQVSKTVNITAGNLSVTLTTSEKQTITNLTITGTIDARDFKTMRDDMPLLAELDLSVVTIEEYTGTEGTFDANSKKYPANTIPARAFYDSNIYAGKPNFKLILLPNNTKAIDEFAFLNLTGLISVFIPSSVNSIGDLAFSGISGMITVHAENPSFSSMDGVLFNILKTTLIQCPISKSRNYVIPSTVNTIGIFAFSHCRGLTSVTVPSSVKSIEGDAFVGCKGLKSINIPTSVTFIGHQAFQDCSSLLSVVIPYSVITIDWWAFAGSSGIFDVDSNNPNYSSDEGVLYKIGRAHV